MTMAHAFRPGLAHGALLALALLTGCAQPLPPPPPPLVFEGLPVSGSLAVARRAGFTNCDHGTTAMRCRRTVTVRGQGPFKAAIDLAGSDGRGGFSQLILWHDRDQYALFALADAFKGDGWHECFTSLHDRGDQAVYTQDGAPVIVSMDLSYWGKRRLRLLPARAIAKRRC